MWNMERWDLLPDELLLIIFKYLKDSDLVSASSSCRQWRRVYHDPSLWRSRTFEFRGYCRSHSDRLLTLKKYVYTLGSYMQHIHIICPSPNLLTAQCVAKCVHTVLRGLSSLHHGTQTIQSFQMCELHFDKTWSGFRSSKCLLVDSVSTFLEYQTNLKSFNMQHAFLTPPFAFRILKHFARSKSTRTMETINIVNYYSLEVSTRIIGIQLRTVCKMFWKLREITLNYSYLSSAKVVDLCELLDDSLEKLIIHVTILDFSRGWNVITSDSWRLACQTCPCLKVSLHIEGWPRDAAMYMTPCMPLVELSLTGCQCRYSSLTLGDKTNLMLCHLSQWFPHSLTSVTFQTESPAFSPPHRNTLIDFLSVCQNVKTVFFSNRLMTPEFINEVKFGLSSKLMKDVDVVKIL